jgi:LPXTG-motif cell wall-anchored protein
MTLADVTVREQYWWSSKTTGAGIVNQQSTTSTIRRLAGAAAFSAVLALGVGTAGAQDLHSGGVSPNEESSDPGGTSVAGTSTERGGGLPVTGSDVAGLVVAGAAAIAVGTGAVAVSKRRTRLSA